MISRSDIQRFLEDAVVLFVQVTGRGKSHPLYRKHKNRLRGRKAAITRRVNKADKAFDAYVAKRSEGNGIAGATGSQAVAGTRAGETPAIPTPDTWDDHTDALANQRLGAGWLHDYEN